MVNFLIFRKKIIIRMVYIIIFILWLNIFKVNLFIVVFSYFWGGLEEVSDYVLLIIL